MPPTLLDRAVFTRLALWALVGWVAGAALQLQQAALWSLWIYACFGLVALSLIALSATKYIAYVWRCLGVLVGAGVLSLALTGARSAQFVDQGLDPDLQGRDLAVWGVISAMPQVDEVGTRFEFAPEQAMVNGQLVRLPARLSLAWYQGLAFAGTGATGMPQLALQRSRPDLRAGERWQFTVRLKVPHGNRNPWGFDYELWMWEQGLQATGYVRVGTQDPPPQRLAQTWRYPVEQLRQGVRDAILLRLSDARVAGLLAALVVGDQNAIERADWDVFRATGVAHLMSISGLHITMFAWLAAAVVGWLWRRSSGLCLRVPAVSAALVAGMLLAALYALFSGWGVPAQRTVLMLVTVGLLRLSGKQWPWPAVWMLACAVVVAVDPWALLQAGFWLSFVAVGVLFATDSGANSAASASVRHRFVAMLREQWVITIALAPLTLLLFGQVSLIGLVANALAIPWVTLLVTPLAMAGIFFAPAWDVAGAALQLLGGILAWLAELPWAVLNVPRAPVWAGAAGLVGGALLAMRLPPAMRLAGVPLLLPVLLWQAPRPALGHFELLAPDVGQGNAVLVRTATHALVYDAGPRFSAESDAGHRVLVPLLRALGEEVDTLVLSHRDTDHVGGAATVLAQQPNAMLLSSLESEHPLLSPGLGGSRVSQRCHAGQRWQWDGVDFEVLHPLVGDYALAAKPNTLSCVVRVSNGVQAALLAGDIEQAQEARLVAAGANLSADVLLVPHHGSKTSSSDAFLAAVQPRFALVQAGYRNRYGHPAEPVLVRYRQHQIAVLESPHCGAFTWHSAQPTTADCYRLTQTRYWHHPPQPMKLREYP